MTLHVKDMFNETRELKVKEIRTAREDYDERVIYTEDTDAWHAHFQSLCGSPLKPAGKRPDRAAKRITKEYGGIYNEQTLFAVEKDEGMVIVMFWPWQNGLYTTVKTIST